MRSRRRRCTARSAKPRFPAATSWRRRSSCWTPTTNLLRCAAGFGDDIKRLRAIDISIVADTPEGLGVCGQAFRDQKICISNDYLNDVRSLAWRQGAVEAHIGAGRGAAAGPATAAVSACCSLPRPRGRIAQRTGRPVSLLGRMSANISYALGNFDHEAARQEWRAGAAKIEPDVQRHQRPPTRRFFAPRPNRELYQFVCDAAVHSGKSTASVVLLAEPDSTWLTPAAGTGEIVKQFGRTRFSIDPTTCMEAAFAANAFRTRKPCVNGDILNSAQGLPWRELGREVGASAGVAVPLIRAGNSIGVLLFSDRQILGRRR